MTLTNRIFKVISCFAVIAVILIASLTVPAKAVSWTALLLSDYISDIHYEGNIRKVTYDFPLIPLLRYRYSDLSGDAYGSIALEVDHTDELPIYFDIYPLGSHCVGGPPLSNASSGCRAIDVSDLKSDAIIRLSSNFHIELGFAYASSPDIHSNESIYMSLSWTLHRYASDGVYLGSQDSGSTTHYFTLQDMPEFYVFEQDIYQYVSLSSFYGRAVYIVPFINASLFYSSDSSYIDLYEVSFGFDDFTITAGTDMLLEQSLTLDAIDDKLGDLNEDTDTLISGTPEMEQAADDAKDQYEGFRDEAERLEEEEASFLEDFEQSCEEMWGKINSLVEGQGWTQLSSLVSPIMNWQYSGVLMLLVVAFINMSVILFGR